jgi:hypothetical protein
MSALPITLSQSDMALGGVVGVRRYLVNRQEQRSYAKYGAGRYNAAMLLANDKLGARGELAVLRAEDRPLTDWVMWRTGEHPSAYRGDVAGREVRTRGGRWAALPLHPEDQGVFILVYAPSPPEFLICGWLEARLGKRHEFWLAPPAVPSAAFFVPRALLHPMETLDGWRAVPVP